jgi:hypothetical protein
LGGGIGGGDELRRDVGGCTPSRIVEMCQIILHGTPRNLRIDVVAPLITRRRAAFIGVSDDQARINREALAANQSRRDAPLNDAFEHAAKDIAVAKAFVACSRKCRVIRYPVLNAEPTKPSICQVHLTSRQSARSERIAKT